ncbi:MAG TPA: endolytic transglycosylase MltG [Dongiaceae bacterium]|nr:endolytic transglycosylase MltG [Dongiaceae bacterium]
MDDFRRRPVNKVAPQPAPQPGMTPQARASQQLPVTTPVLAQPPVTSHQPQPIHHSETPPKMTKKKRIIIGVSGLIVIIIAAIAALFVWYMIQLRPVNAGNTDRTLITIASGTTPDEIARDLKDKGLIRSPTAFMWYTKLSHTQNLLQAGTYRLSPSESTQQIVDHLNKGLVDTFKITFLPGATVMQNKKVFLDVGYKQSNIDAAFSATYDSPLFVGKPASADLEGYIWGDTYEVGADATVSQILQKAFDEYNKNVQDNNLVAQFQSHGLSLYEGITLASIIQREASGTNNDDAQIAQVFYKRLGLNMPLGSDVTYQYIADKLGVPRDPNLDSPYNTRRYAGLPPGPISTPGIKALLAVAQPASGDYLYFLSGDDGVTYFANTLEEHNQNIANHCKVKCSSL